MNLTKTFSQLNKKDADIAGGKGASLGEMLNANIPVPDGFVVLAQTFEQFIKETDINVEIDSILHSVKPDQIHTVEKASSDIQNLIKTATMPKNIADEILSQFDILDTEYVAVRSSATAEDGADHAWAGQLDSYLNITKETVLEKVQDCWASLFTPRAIFYRFEKNLHTTHISVAVVVQKMVNSELSGIAFSVHPVTEDRNQLIIEAGLGLGEAIVSGQITPDSYVVEKEPRRIIDINISEQNKALYRKEGGGNTWKDLGEEGSKQVLTENQITELSNIIINIENHYGFPCDIEWAFENDTFYVVQSRPITTLSELELNIVNNQFKGDFIIPRVRERSLSPCYWNSVLQTGSDALDNYGKVISSEYLLFSNGQMKAFIPKEEWLDIAEFVSDRILNEEGFFEGLEKKTNRAKEKIESFLIEIKGTGTLDVPAKELIGYCENIYELFMKYDAPSVFSWFIAGDSLKQKIGAEIGLYGEDLDIISLPENQTYATQMEKDILEIALKKVSDIENISKSLAEKYYWIPFDNDGPDIWDAKYFVDRLNEAQDNIIDTRTRYEEILNRTADIKEKSNQIIKKLNERDKGLVEILRKTATWTDERKMLEFQLFYFYSQILLRLSDLFDISLTQLKNLFVHELANLDTRLSELKETANNRFRNDFVVAIESGVSRIMSDLEVSQIKEIADQQIKPDGDLRGIVACKGKDKKYRAKVKILKTSKECSKVEVGEFLVATMTTPDYIPAMSRAIGFITDEGGVTCHAAIVAREMNKPCVIATKFATQILEDGDIVEVNSNNGIIKKVN